METYKIVEQEVNQIRLIIYDKTMNLTPEQYTDRVRKIGDEAVKKYGYQRVASTNKQTT